MAPPAYRSGSTAGDATGTNLTVNVPAGVADNDLLFIVLYREGGSWTMPGGWTQLFDVPNFNATATVTVAWKRASSEPANYTFNLSASVWRIATMVALSGGITTGSPVDVSTSAADNNSSVVAPSMTTLTNDVMLLWLTANLAGADITVGSSAMTQGAQLGGCEVWYVTQPTAGATGTKTFGNSGMSSGDWAGIFLAVLPDTGVVPDAPPDWTAAYSAQATAADADLGEAQGIVALGWPRRVYGYPQANRADVIDPPLIFNWARTWPQPDEEFLLDPTWWIEPAADDPSLGVLGDSAQTQDPQTTAASGTVDFAASAVPSQDAQQAAGAGSVPYAATSAQTQGVQTTTASANIGTVLTASAAIEQGRQTESAAASVAFAGAGNVSQGAQQDNAAASVAFAASAAEAQGAQQTSAAASIGLTGAANQTQGAQTEAGAASVAFAGAYGQAQGTQRDTAAASVAVAAGATIPQGVQSTSASANIGSVLTANGTLSQTAQQTSASASVNVAGNEISVQGVQRTVAAANVSVAGAGLVAQGAQQTVATASVAFVGVSVQVQGAQTTGAAAGVIFTVTANIEQGPQLVVLSAATPGDARPYRRGMYRGQSRGMKPCRAC